MSEASKALVVRDVCVQSTVTYTTHTIFSRSSASNILAMAPFISTSTMSSPACSLSFNRARLRSSRMAYKWRMGEENRSETETGLEGSGAKQG